MTESDWLTAIDTRPMLEHLRGKATDRKLRLFVCACFREGRSRLLEPQDCSDGWPRELHLAESYADGNAGWRALDIARSSLGARGGYSAAWALNNLHFHLVDVDSQFAAESSANLLVQLVRLHETEELGKPPREVD